jgi:glycosyltransferase involved in cell wall biosynthesis
VLADLHKFPPTHGAGAEYMALALFSHLVKRGHTVRVMADVPCAVVEGIRVGPLDLSAYDEADVVVTHLDRTRQVVDECHRRGLPLIHLLHNGGQLAFHKVTAKDATCVVFNSDWLRRESSWPGAWTICRPPVDPAAYEVDHPTDASGFVALVNMTGAKGAGTFAAAARALPRLRFLGVKGAYGHQILPPPGTRNVTVIDQTDDIRADVYARTSVVLMPSHYESWGRVAVEACCASIPVIAHPTPGLKEALGDAGIFVAHNDHRGYVRELGRLMADPGWYADQADAGRARAAELAEISRVDLAVWEELVSRSALR